MEQTRRGRHGGGLGMASESQDRSSLWKLGSSSRYTRTFDGQVKSRPPCEVERSNMPEVLQLTPPASLGDRLLGVILLPLLLAGFAGLHLLHLAAHSIRILISLYRRWSHAWSSADRTASQISEPGPKIPVRVAVIWAPSYCIAISKASLGHRKRQLEALRRDVDDLLEWSTSHGIRELSLYDPSGASLTVKPTSTGISLMVCPRYHARFAPLA